MEINSYFILSFLLSSFKKKKAEGEKECGGSREGKNKQIFSLRISFGNRLVFLYIYHMYVLYIYLDFFAVVAAAVASLERCSNIEPLTLV